MLSMILRMSLATAFYILLTRIVWSFWERRKIGTAPRVLVGLVFGACSVLANHISIDYGNLLLNVRDIGPLAAGLFFDPLSGVIAGLIGGAERFAASEIWGIGVYTRNACSIATVMAGLLPAVLRFRFHREKRPPALFCFFLGAVTEVFHMYAVFFFHRDDTAGAYAVVKTASLPMIAFTALGLAACSLVVKYASGESSGRFRLRSSLRTLTNRFQFWLMLGTSVIFLVNYAISFALQNQTALQTARYKLEDWSGDMEAALNAAKAYEDKMTEYVYNEVVSDLRVIATVFESTTQASPEHAATPSRLKTVRYAMKIRGLYLLSHSGEVLAAGGEAFPGFADYSPVPGSSSFGQLISGKARETLLTDSSRESFLAVVPCGDGFLCSLSDVSDRTDSLDFAVENNPLFSISLPEEACYLIFYDDGETETALPLFGTGQTVSEDLTPEQTALLRSRADGDIFYSGKLFVPGLCLCRSMGEGNLFSLVILRSEKVFEDRDAMSLESAFSDILVFVALYLIVSALMEKIVADPMNAVNQALRKITGGHLDTTVSVRSSVEFEALSDDINATVDTLKGYISAAEKRMENDLLLAKTIQASALPSNFSFPRTDFELYATMNPAREVGGDFYDFFMSGADRLVLVIADVSGKSIPGALFMMRARSAIRNAAESGISSPAEIFRRANLSLCEGNDAEMFVTAWIGMIDLKTGRMDCANAGHEYPMISRGGDAFELFRDSHSLALAIIPKAPMKEYSLNLSPGDRLFVYTDGIPEAINIRSEAYGTERLLAALNAHRTESQKEVLEAVRQDLSAFVGEAEPFDDVTMLGFAYNGPQQNT